MRTPPYLVFLFCIGLWQTAQSEILHWPQLCDGGQLLVKNKTHDELSVWLQKFSDNPLSETEYEVKANAVSVITLSALAKNERYALLNFNAVKDLQITYRCNAVDYPASALEGGLLTFKKSDLLPNKIWLQNLYTDTNTIEIEFQDFAFKKIESENITLVNQESRTLVIGEHVKNWSYFRISAANKFSVFNLTSTGSEHPVLVKPQASRTEDSSFYFLVGPRSGNDDTFIVKIKDLDMAERARDLIRHPSKEKMLFARIQKNHQGFNRNWSKPEKNFWSWSATEVTGFGDLGSTSCNGTPQFIEDRIDRWVDDPGQICFWSYRVKKELTPLEVSSGSSK